MKSQTIRVRVYSVLAVLAIAAGVSRYMWQVINPSLQQHYARDACSISTMLNEYVECNKGVFPTSVTQLRAQGFLRVSAGVDELVYRVRYFREYNDWRSCEHYANFQIRYGASLHDQGIAEPGELIAAPVTNGHTKIREARRMCQRASADLVSRMQHYAGTNAPEKTVYYARTAKRDRGIVVPADFHANPEILIEISAGYAAGFTPLHYAATVGNRLLVDKLVRNGADVNAADSGGFTPLHAAVINGHYDIVKYLLQHGANLEAKTHFGTTPLFEAIYNDDAAMVRLLIDKGADTQAMGLGDRTLVRAAEQKGYLQIVSLLKNYTR